MVKAHLAILLVGLGANQAFTSDDERDRHWAEGVYFPPITAPSVVQNNSRSIASPPVQQIRRNPWLAQDFPNSVNQLKTPQSLGYPAEGYDPYQPSERAVNTPPSRHKNDYVPDNYSPGRLKDYYAIEDRNGYRVNGFKSREDYHRDEYYTGYYEHGDMRHKYRPQGGYIRHDYDPVESDYHGKDYRYQYGLNGYREAMPSDNFSRYDNSSYGGFLGNSPYHPDWNTGQILDDARLLQFPWEFMWPLSNSDVPYYLLW